MSARNVIANRYEVVSHIGQGGMADVFLAVDTILNRQVAVKILRADLSTDAVSILRFEREAQAAAALAHPNIVEIYDVGDYKGHHYIVMEYVPGKTLKQVIRSRGPLVNEEAVDIMKQLCSAVSEAHSRGIIHRDLKPQNVIVKADGSVKILDFGIATAKGSMQLTQANNVMGSVHYLAPELAKGEAASPQSDIYALGIVFYEMLAGDVPFKAEQAVQIALKHMREAMPSIRSMNSSVPQSVENIITRSTAKNPSIRYRSAEEMLADVSTCLRPERLNERKLVLRDPLPKKTPKAAEQEHAAPINPETGNYEHSRTHTTARPTHRNTRNKVTMILILVLSIIAVIGIGAAVLFNMLPRHGNVPDIEGMSVDAAKELLEKEGLALDESNISYELTTDTEKGMIISVDPSINTEVEEGTAVTVTVSSGIGVTAENYTGRNINTVEKELANKYPNLKVNAIEEQSGADGGTITAQEGIKAGDLFDPNAVNTITLTYAAYPTITIPSDVIGKPINEASAELEGLGIEVRTSNRDTTSMSQEELDQLQVGVVIESDPAAGTSYTQKQDNYVTLYYY